MSLGRKKTRSEVLADERQIFRAIFGNLNRKKIPAAQLSSTRSHLFLDASAEHEMNNSIGHLAKLDHSLSWKIGVGAISAFSQPVTGVGRYWLFIPPG